jgi:hypothetical protein
VGACAARLNTLWRLCDHKVLALLLRAVETQGSEASYAAAAPNLQHPPVTLVAAPCHTRPLPAGMVTLRMQRLQRASSSR